RSESSDANRPVANSTDSSTTPHSVLKFAAAIVAAALVTCVFVGPGLLAKTGRQASSQGSSTTDPEAMEALNKMGVYLRSLKAFEVDSEVTKHDVLDDGQIITDTRTNTLLSVSPNLLRAELKSDDNDVLLFYNGRHFTVYGKLVNYYATVPAPS